MTERKVFERYLKVDEEKRLFAEVAKYSDIHARRDHAWMRLLRQTGIRVQTLGGLDVADAKEALRTGYLDLRCEITKRKQGGKVFLTKKARAAIKDLLGVRRDMGHAEQPDAPLVCSRNHKRMAVRSYQARMRCWCEAAGLDRMASPHWLRHTLAKRIMANSTGRDPRGEVARVLCHRSIASTEVYTQPDLEDIERAMEEAS